MTPDRPSRSRITLVALVAAILLARPAISQEVALGLRSFESLSVSAAERTEASKVTDAGVVSVAGASGMVITLAAELKGRTDRDGTIGLLLIPDLPYFDSLYRTRGVLLPGAEVTTAVAAGTSSYVLSKSVRLDVGFPRYRLVLYNTTGASAAVNVYVYPTRN